MVHVRHINTTQEHPRRILKIGRRLASNLNYEGLSFLCKKKILARLRYKIFVLTCLVMKMSWIFISEQKFEDYRFITFI